MYSITEILNIFRTYSKNDNFYQALIHRHSIFAMNSKMTIDCNYVIQSKNLLSCYGIDAQDERFILFMMMIINKPDLNKCEIKYI